MKLRILSVLAMAAALALSACATDPTWERLRPPGHMVTAANGCPVITIDDAAPLSRWKKVGDFWDQDSCQGTPFKRAEIEGRMEVSREDVRKRAAAGDKEAINLTTCWDQKNYMSWTAPASSSLIGHEWNAIPYTCVDKDDPRLAGSSAAGTPQVAGK